MNKQILRTIQTLGIMGSIAGTFPISLRDVHPRIEMMHVHDITSSIDLLIATITELDQRKLKL